MFSETTRIDLSGKVNPLRGEREADGIEQDDPWIDQETGELTSDSEEERKLEAFLDAQLEIRFGGEAASLS